MQEDEDFLTRQIRAIGQGLGVAISGKNGGPTQIVFPKKSRLNNYLIRLI